MTDVRTFKAASMQEALNIVRNEMGADAVILHTRELPPSRFLGWARNKERVEITAGLGVNIRPPTARLHARPPAPPARPARTAAPSAPASPAQAFAAAAETSSPPRSQHVSPESAMPNRRSDQTLAPPPPLLSERNFGGGMPQAAPRPHAFGRERATPTEVLPPPLSQRAPVAQNLPVAQYAPVPQPPLENQASIAQQLSSIRQMVEKLSRNVPSGHAEEIPQDLFQIYTELIDAEVEDDLARELVFRLKQNLAPEQFRDLGAAKAQLTGMLAADIRCARPWGVTPGRRRVVALVGPTGVGKTTTIAKLAANFRLRDGIRMGLVTVDTYRIAAVEQLRTYAEIIDLPMKVVTSPREMRRALDELSGLDLVLIDTAGRSPRDELKIQELKSLLAEAQVDEVHLVLSLVSSLRSLEATAEKFAVANTTSMILTKLDEAAGMGTLLSATRKIPLPISYITTGQNVPDDIEAAAGNRISRLILGQDSLYAKSHRQLQ